jgi:hypothetical protein
MLRKGNEKSLISCHALNVGKLSLFYKKKLGKNGRNPGLA